MLIRIKGLSGVLPAIAPTELPASNAQIATNCRFDAVELRPWDGQSQVFATMPKPGTIRTIYRFGQDVSNDTQYWFHWATDVNVVRGPVAGDTSELTYYTGDGLPKVTDSSLALTGATQEYPIGYRTLGVPHPTTSPTLAATGTPGSGSNQTFAYVYTWVAQIGPLLQESKPSDASTVVVAPNQTVNVTTQTSPPTGYNITLKRVYRTEGTTGLYFLVAELPAGNGTHNDTLQSVGEPLPSLTWEMPPSDLAGLVALDNGILAGFSGKDVFFCEPFRPFAWPLDYVLTCDYKIVGLCPSRQGLFVGTQGVPYYISGVDPASMSMDRIDFAQALVSKRSMVPVPGGAIYASPDGLCYIGEGGNRVLTDGVLTYGQWQAYKPESISGYYHDGRYFGFYDTGSTQAGFIFDFRDRRQPFSNIDVYATAGYVDLLRDRLFLVIGGALKTWGTNAASPIPLTWRSKRFVLPYEMNFACAQVLASAYPMTFSLYCDDALKYSGSVANATPFRLPSGFRYRIVEMQVSGTGRPFEIAAATSMEELSNV